MTHHFFIFSFFLSIGAFVALGIMGYILKFVFDAGTAVFYILNPLYVLTLGPIVYGIKKVIKSRCPNCGQFFALHRVKTEVTQEREVVRAIPRTERGVLYSNRLFSPNQDIEFIHPVDMPYVETSLKEVWACSSCGHEKKIESSFEYEGSLDD